MSKNKLLAALLLLAIDFNVSAQPLTLDAIIDSIRLYNPILKMYQNEISSMDEAAKGARSWMPPELSTGFWMTPYNTDRWKKMDDGMGGTREGMGQYMLGAQQMLPNKKKQKADVAYMEAMSSSRKETLKASLNEIISEAKQNYYDWLVLKKELSILEQNEKLLDFMIRNAEIRYKNGLEKISAYYKARAAIGNVQNMRLMAENDIRNKRIRLNALMGKNALNLFEIDTVYQVQNYGPVILDSSLFYSSRSDLKAIDKEINLAQLQVEVEKQSLKPQFGVRYEHMFGFGGLPMQFSLMGMMRLPNASWSSKMSKASIQSLHLKTASLRAQKEMMVNEYSGMAYTMISELELKKKQIVLYEDQIIPALRNNYRTMQLGYEQNTEELFMLFDAWEILYMKQLEYTSLLAELLTLQVSFERVIEKL